MYHAAHAYINVAAIASKQVQHLRSTISVTLACISSVTSGGDAPSMATSQATASATSLATSHETSFIKSSVVGGEGAALGDSPTGSTSTASVLCVW
jgi:hypothetical protein